MQQSSASIHREQRHRHPSGWTLQPQGQRSRNSDQSNEIPYIGRPANCGQGLSTTAVEQVHRANAGHSQSITNCKTATGPCYLLFYPWHQHPRVLRWQAIMNASKGMALNGATWEEGTGLCISVDFKLTASQQLFMKCWVTQKNLRKPILARILVCLVKVTSCYLSPQLI